jgi:hypothetical protein
MRPRRKPRNSHADHARLVSDDRGHGAAGQANLGAFTEMQWVTVHQEPARYPF